MLVKEGLEATVHEVYSPKRVNAMAEKLGLISGLSLDLTVNDTDGEPWDFNVKEKRDKAEKIKKMQKCP